MRGALLVVSVALLPFQAPTYGRERSLLFFLANGGNRGLFSKPCQELSVDFFPTFHGFHYSL